MLCVTYNLELSNYRIIVCDERVIMTIVNFALFLSDHGNVCFHTPRLPKIQRDCELITLFFPYIAKLNVIIHIINSLIMLKHEMIIN